MSVRNKRQLMHVVACKIMQAELEAASAGMRVELHLLDQGLHQTPAKMPGLIQAEIDRIPADAGPVLLGYGLCSNGLLGLKAGPQGLVAPRAHDCLSFFLGSPAEYMRRFNEQPGTYFMTQGWMATGMDPLGCMQEDYAPRLGMERAEWCMREELRNYTHFCLIDNKVGDLEALRRRTRQNCDFFGKEYEEIKSGLGFFRKLLQGPYDNENFIVLKPGQKISLDMFI